MPFSCFLFRPRKSRERRRKCSHTNVSNTLVTRPSTPPAQTAHVRFHERTWVHTRLSEKDRTQGLTRRNRGVSDGGGITTLGLFHTFRKPCVARGAERRTLPLLGLGRGCSQRAQRACGAAMRMMRVAVTRRRGPAGLRDPIAVSLTAPMGFAVLVSRDYRVQRKAHFAFMHRAALPALPAPSAALLYALMH